MTFEPIRVKDVEWARVCKPMAIAVDAVMPSDRDAFGALLEVMRTSAYFRETRTVMRLVRLADDPLSRIGTLAQDALRSWEQLIRLAAASGWTRPEEILSSPRPTALYHLAEAVAHRRYVPTGTDVTAFQRICARLEAAARKEKIRRVVEFEQLALMREAALPGLKERLDRWVGV